MFLLKLCAIFIFLSGHVFAYSDHDIFKDDVWKRIHKRASTTPPAIPIEDPTTTEDDLASPENTINSDEEWTPTEESTIIPDISISK